MKLPPAPTNTLGNTFRKAPPTVLRPTLALAIRLRHRTGDRSLSHHPKRSFVFPYNVPFPRTYAMKTLAFMILVVSCVFAQQPAPRTTPQASGDAAFRKLADK